MSVVSITESWSGITWGGDSEQRTTVRVFLVETDTPGRGVFTFPISSGGVTVPKEGTAHPDISQFISGVPTITAQGPTLFEIRIGYSAAGIAGGYEAENPYADPLSQPADVSWEDEQELIPYDVDLAGNATITAAGEPIDPPLTRTVSDPVLLIERNEAAFSPQTKLNYQDTVCNHVFWGAEAGRPRMGQIRARKVQAKTAYWRVGYRVVFRMTTPHGAANAWKRVLLHQGHIYLDANGIQRRFADGAVKLLAEDGKPLAFGKLARTLKFVEFEEASWAPLGINNP